MDTLISSIYSKDLNKICLLTTDGHQLTYSEYLKQAKEFSKKLISCGLHSGDFVATVFGNGIEFLVSFLGITSSRCVVAPLNPAYLEDEFTFYLKDTQAKVIIVTKETPDSYPALIAAKKQNIPVWRTEIKEGKEEVAEPKAEENSSSEDIAMILHTSGTTSLPKGVPLTQRNLVISAKNIAETYQLSPKDNTLIVMPLFHVHGLIGATLRGTVVIPPRFSASAFWKDVEKYDITWYSAVPTIHQILLMRADEDKAPHGKLRFIRSCSSSLAPVILEKLEKRFGAPVLEAYGMTEASHQVASNPLPPNERKIGSVGRGTNVQVAILDPATGKPIPENELGEISIKGDNVTKGYHNNPKANSESWTMDGWFRTGDQGFIDKGGYITLTGRIKELINRGGEKISPPEIDATLLQHEAVAEAISFGMPDGKYGEEIAVAIVLKEEFKNREIKEMETSILQFCKTKLAAFKTPKKIFFADNIPKTATGKVQRRFVASFFLQSHK